MSELTYKTDDDIGLIEIFADGVLIVEWVYDDNPEDTFDEFKKVYGAGGEEYQARVTELENALNGAADDVEKQKVVGEGRRLHYSHKYRAIAKGKT